MPSSSTPTTRPRTTCWPGLSTAGQGRGGQRAIRDRVEASARNRTRCPRHIAAALDVWPFLSCGLASRLQQEAPGPGVTLVDVASQAGPHRPSTGGMPERKRFIIETNGAGVALADLDGDGWLDALVLNGTRLGKAAREPAVAAGEAPTARLYRNRLGGILGYHAGFGPRPRRVVVIGLRRRLRQRRPPRSLHDRIRHQHAVPQWRLGSFRGCHRAGRPANERRALGIRMHLSGYQVATAGSICSCPTT